MDKPNALFVKELTLKCPLKGGANHLTSAYKTIKDMIKKVKVQDTEEAVRQESNEEVHEDLVPIKGKRD